MLTLQKEKGIMDIARVRITRFEQLVKAIDVLPFIKCSEGP